MEMSLEELLNVEITTAGKQEERIGDIPASVVLITRKEIETYGYTSLEEILQNVPGLYMIDQHHQHSMTGFGVRGYFTEGTFSNVVVLVNGINNQMEPYKAQYVLSRIAVPVESIDRIEIVRGPMSVIYGSGAFFGAINIITNEIAEDGQTGIVSASYGTENTSKCMTQIAGSSDEFGFTFNASNYDTDGPDELYSGITSNPVASDSGQTYLNSVGLGNDATTGGQFEDSARYVNFSASYKGFSFDMGHARTRRGYFAGLPAFGDDNYLITVANDAAFGYNREVLDQITLDGRISYLDYNYWRDATFLHRDLFGEQRVFSSAYNVELNGFINATHDLDMTIGLYHNAVIYANNAIDLPAWGLENTLWRLKDGDRSITNDIFAQLDYRLLRNLKFVAGVRASRMEKYDFEMLRNQGKPDFSRAEMTYDQDDINIAPRFAAIYSPNENNILKLLYGKAVIHPSISQNLSNIIQNLSSAFQPELLDLSDIQTVEVTYSTVLFSKLMADVNIFRNELDSLIEKTGTLDENGNWIDTASNSGEIVTNGVEVGLRLRPVENLDLDISGTYQESEDRREGYKGFDLGYSPDFLGYGKMSYRFPHDLSLALSGFYVDEMETKWQKTGPNLGDGHRSGERVDGYLALSLNLRVDDIFKKGSYISIRCYNLFDQEIHYPTDSGVAWADRGPLADGRKVLASAGWKF